MTVAEPNPLNRPPVYSFSTSSTTVEAAAIELSPGIGWARQIIYNSAYDVVTGYKMRSVEPSLRVTVNLAVSPLTLFDAVANKTNASAWAGGGYATWLCTGISANQDSALVGTEVLDYWVVTASFAYRSQGWGLEIKDVGLNERVPKAGGGYQKRRCRVFDNDGNAQPASSPQPLDATGAQLFGDAVVRTKSYTIYEPVEFSNYFASP